MKNRGKRTSKKSKNEIRIKYTTTANIEEREIKV
jgi:hypothetical protein